MEEVYNFPLDILDFFLIWETLEIWNSDLIGKILNFEYPSSLKKHKLKHLKLPKNHFKTNLFFVQLKNLMSTFTFGTNLKIQTPPPLIKKSKFWMLGLIDVRQWSSPPPLDFSYFLWRFLFRRLPLPDIFVVFLNGVSFEHHSIVVPQTKALLQFSLLIWREGCCGGQTRTSPEGTTSQHPW